MDKLSPQSSDAFSGFSAHTDHLALHTDSHAISKLKPKIRIIHVVAPKIIKTDVENFRDLVQKLTGKSAEVKVRTKKACRVAARKGMTSSSNYPKPWTNIQPLDCQGCHILQGTQIIKKEMQCLYKGSDGSRGTFAGFGDIDINFVPDLSQFPLIPFKSSQSQFKNMMFGEIPLC